MRVPLSGFVCRHDTGQGVLDAIEQPHDGLDNLDNGFKLAERRPVDRT